MTQVISLKDVADRLLVNERTVVNLVREGKLTGFKVGKNWRFEEADIDEYVRKQKENAPKEERCG